VAINSAGFSPGPVTDVEYARILGASFASVMEGHHLAVTPGSADRTVSVAAGAISGQGVYSEVTTDTVPTASSNPSSGYRWDAVVLRKNWTAKTSTLVKVENTLLNSYSIPVGCNLGLSNIGTAAHDTLLALYRVNNGLTAVQEIIDYRPFGGGSWLRLRSPKALLPDWAPPGTFVERGGEQWVRDTLTTGFRLLRPNVTSWAARSASPLPGNAVGVEYTLAALFIPNAPAGSYTLFGAASAYASPAVNVTYRLVVNSDAGLIFRGSAQAQSTASSFSRVYQHTNGDLLIGLAGSSPGGGWTCSDGAQVTATWESPLALT
jgi:hypothetical protein